MIYSEYGKTGKMVSAVGFGGMRFDTKKRTDKENAEIVLHAYKKGINYFDTAPMYCDDKSETIFGLAFEQMSKDRDKFFVATKKMPTEGNAAEEGIASVKRSLEKLKIDYIDFFHVWCVRTQEQYELAMKKGGLYEGLLKCKEEGLIKHIVVSTHLPGNKVKNIVDDGYFEGVLMGVNILNFRFRWEGAVAAQKAGLGVVAMNPLAGGLVPGYQKQLAFIAEGNETPVEAAIRFLVSAPQINVALVGFANKEQIDTACKVTENAKPFSEEDIEKIKQKMSENMDVLCTGCGYCESSCPVEIPIPRFMQVYNEKLFCNKSEKDMVNLLNENRQYGILTGTKADPKDCVKCGKCEEVCTQHLNIIERLEEMAKWDIKIEEGKKS
ncbi:aldo/keto reductase [bacterium]|nr:aldo/keto reductase [bacterium]